MEIDLLHAPSMDIILVVQKFMCHFKCISVGGGGYSALVSSLP
jgi:hypothetical protein